MPNLRKRTRSILWDDTHSDPALFSSDPPEPGAENYFAPKKRRQYRGTWWQQQVESEAEKRGKRPFERNLDSGVFMGSDSTIPSSDGFEGEELGVEDKKGGRVAVMAVSLTEPSNVTQARRKIDAFVLAEEEDEAGRPAKGRLDIKELGLPYLTDDMLTPLKYMVGPVFEPQTYLSDDDEGALSPKSRYSSLCPSWGMNASQNAIGSLPASLFELVGLRWADLSGNNLSELPTNISSAYTLHTLYLDANRLRWLPGELLDLLHHPHSESLSLSLSSNALLQPFSFVGFRRMIEETRPDASGEGNNQVTDTHWLHSLPIKWVGRQYASLQMLDADDDLEVNRVVFKTQKQWLLRLVQHVINTVYRTLRTVDSEDGAYTNLHSKVVERALAQETMFIAATNPCRFGVDGRPVEPGATPPSEIPMDQCVLPARFVALPQREDLFQTEPPLGVDHLRPLRPLRPLRASRARSLFALALEAAARVPELPQLPSLLPEDAPQTVFDGLQTAVKVRTDGGRKCYSCGRSYILPRAEWVEYHVLCKPWDYQTHCRSPRFSEELFVPFLRRVCSEGCVPEFDYEDDIDENAEFAKRLAFLERDTRGEGE